MTKALPKIHFTDLHRNISITLSTAVCDANNESETNIAIRMSASKNFFTCPCPCPIHHCC